MKRIEYKIRIRFESRRPRKTRTVSRIAARRFKKEVRNG